LLRRNDSLDLERSRTAFEKAIALDPGYAPAWAGLAQATFWISDRLTKLANIREGYDRAVAAADRAVALGPELGEAYAIRGFLRAIVRWDWNGARSDLERALRLNPGDAEIHFLYARHVLQQMGRPAEAVEEAKRATELDPLDARAWGTYVWMCAADGQLDRALRATDRVLEIHPEEAGPSKAFVLLLLGRPAEALTWADVTTDPVWRLWTIAVAAHSLDRPESRRALDRLVATAAERAAYQIAEVFAWWGEREKALEWLERAYQQHDSGLQGLKADPMLRDLRGDPRFAALVRKVGLPVP
jgi:serine/threonine-protein kinase